MSAADDLRLAIADPNATTPRLPHEHIVDWQVRAIIAAGWVPPERVRLVRDSVRDVSDERAKAIERVRGVLERIETDDHVEGCGGEPDCAACVTADLRTALDGKGARR